MHHMQPERGASDLLRCVYVAWQIADLVGFSVLNGVEQGSIGRITAAVPEKAAQTIVGMLDNLAEEVALNVNLVECSLLERAG